MSETLENLTDLPDGGPRSAASGDLLSHVLAQIRLTGDRVESRPVAPGEARRLHREEKEEAW